MRERSEQIREWTKTGKAEDEKWLDSRMGIWKKRNSA
jgi:hypothetical protein